MSDEEEAQNKIRLGSFSPGVADFYNSLEEAAKRRDLIHFLSRIDDIDYHDSPELVNIIKWIQDFPSEEWSKIALNLPPIDQPRAQNEKLFKGWVTSLLRE